MAQTSLVAELPWVRPAAPRLSMRLWDLDWARHLPWCFDGVAVEAGSFGDALPFVRAHYARIFGADTNAGRFLADPLTEAKRRFGDEMDVFLFRASGQTVGLLMAHPSDWTTYYMRSVALLPEYRDRHLLTRFVESTYEPLRAVGVERIEGDCSPANTAMMRMLTGLGFLVTSTANSERWGASVRFAKFLREEAEEVFVRQYCNLEPKSSRRPCEPGRVTLERRRP